MRNHSALPTGHDRFGRSAAVLLFALVLVSPAIAQTITTVAGGWSPDNIPAVSANLNFPTAVTRDGAGNLYVADTLDHRVRKISAAGTITTFAGNGNENFAGDDGAATSAALAEPWSVALDASGNLLIADAGNNRVRKVTPGGIISTLAGSGSSGAPTGDGGLATSATLNFPTDVAVDSLGNVYVADPVYNRIRKINTSGIITTVAGNGTRGFSGDGGQAVYAQLSKPQHVAVDAYNNVYISDQGNQRIRRVTPGGTISTVIGNGVGAFAGDGGFATQASIRNPGRLFALSDGSLILADTGNQRIRRVDPSGLISTIAGTGAFGYGGDGGKGIYASFAAPEAVAPGANGDIYIVDTGNYRIRKLSSTGYLSAVAGTGLFPYSFHGDGGSAVGAGIEPFRIAVDANDTLLIADIGNNRIRQVNAAGIISTLAGNGIYGTLFNPYGPATGMSTPTSVAWLGSSVVFADFETSEIARVISTNSFDFPFGTLCYSSNKCADNVIVTPNGDTYFTTGSQIVRVRNGSTTVIAGGTSSGFAGDGGAATSALLKFPLGLATDIAGSLYIADSYNHRIRKVDTSGTIRTIAGNGSPGFSGDGGTATGASLNLPTAVAADVDGSVYVADLRNHRIRRIDPNGVISTLAGSGSTSSSGDGGPALYAGFASPFDVKIDSHRNLFVVDGPRVRKFALPALPAATVPGAPTSVVATAGNASANVSFAPPNSNGGRVITGYSVVSSPAGGVDFNAGQPVLNHNITGLTNGVAYTFTVLATNAVGTGAPSAPSNAVTPTGPDLPVISIGDMVVKEGDASAAMAYLPVSMTSATTSDVSFDIVVSAGTATPGTDYATNVTTYRTTIHAGQRYPNPSAFVNVIGDTQIEPDETVRVSIGNVSGGAVIGRSQGTLTILNDDGGGPVTASDELLFERDRTSQVDAIAGVLENDADAFGDTLAVSLAKAPLNGTVDLHSDGSFEYTPMPGFAGSDYFLYQACDQHSLCKREVAWLTVGYALSSSYRYIWDFPSAANDLQQGFLRLYNPDSYLPHDVELNAISDDGFIAPRTIKLRLTPGESRQLNSQDLAFGNSAKGLTGAFGSTSGSWTLIVSGQALPAAYIRTPEGFLTSIHNRVLGTDVPIFNPADNSNQVSYLRLVNIKDVPVDVLIDGTDDSGQAAPGGSVALTLSPKQSAWLSANDLELGNPAKGLAGHLGDGAGKWRLKIASSADIRVQSLLTDPTGHISNLSQGSSERNRLWFVPNAANTQQQGFIRVSNTYETAGMVTLSAIDDAGHAAPGTVTFTLGPHESRQFNSQDLENGNSAKGTGALGHGTGDWRVAFDTTLTLDTMALIRTPDGFLSAVSDQAPVGYSLSNSRAVTIFNPAENVNQVSVLRLINPGSSAINLTISGTDDSGAAAPGGTVSLTLAAGAAISLSAHDLEAGNTGKGLTGALGDGNGKWRLTVQNRSGTADGFRAISLLYDPQGYLTDLSSDPSSNSSLTLPP